jgi:4-deoxy-L-threo-5-hexosulose-uronate ketol-isomerase
MEERYACSPAETRTMDTTQLRENFLIQDLFETDRIRFTYTHFDRMIAGGVMPRSKSLTIENYDQLKSEYFLERREMGIINIGGEGNISADGENYKLNKLDCLYLGKDTRNISFNSNNAGEPSKFFILSSPAHQTFPNSMMTSKEATPAALGSGATSNERTIYKYIHQDGIKSCQLVMGFTILNEGSVWNTMPAHTHNRRMEVYLYFDVKAENSVFHFMGEPQETRHLVIGNEEAVISPPWSIHSGCGTSSYSFIWGMAGENQSFSDMDGIAIKDLK